jgi:hypothetical protein
MTRSLALVSFTALVLWAHVASAKPKVALTQIEGDAGGDVRNAVAEALEGKELSLIGSKEVNRAVDKLGAVAALTEKDLHKVAVELEADAVVLGKLDKTATGKTLKFRLYIHNRMAKGFTVTFKDPRSEKFRLMLHDKMVDKISTASPEAADDKSAKKTEVDADDDTLPPRTDAKDAKDAKARPVGKVAEDPKAKPDAKDAPPRPVGKAGEDEAAKPSPVKPSPAKANPADEVAPAKSTEADDEAARKAQKKVAAAGEPGGTEGVAVQVAPVRAGNRAAARLDIGVSFAQRSFAFETANLTNKPRDSTLSAAPGLRFEAELYPLALGKPRGKLANLGLAGSYDHTFGLTVASASMPAATVAVSQTSYDIGLRYRMAFGTTPTSATLTFGLGYGQRTFAPGQFQNNQQASSDVARDAPATDYAVIDPGVRFRLPVTQRFAVSLGARGLVVLGAGGIQDGTSYGQATVYGGEGTLALDVMLGRRFAVRLAGEYTQFGFSFAGKGALSNNVDSDSTTKDVSGLSDRSVGGSATVAVVY